MLNTICFLKPVKFSIMVSMLFATTGSYAQTIQFAELLSGTFTTDGISNNYTLSSNADGTNPSVTSKSTRSPSCDNIIGCTGTGTFLRDETDVNSFYGDFSFKVSDYFLIEEDESTFSYSISYFGTLDILGGTGAYAGATGSGEFKGTDLYYTIFDNSPSGAAAARMFIPPPAGTTKQAVYWALTTPDISEVPVPAAAWLLGSALLGFAGVRRKANIG